MRRLRDGLRRVPPRWWFPIVLSLVVLVLAAAGISGSSVSEYGDGSDNGLVAGKARVIRTDEYWIRTPLVVRSVREGFPDDGRIGVGTHDLGVVSQLPTNGLGVVLLPYTAPYHVLGLDQAFALEWWLIFLWIPALGVYAFLVALGVRLSIAIPAALMVVWSPGVQWWTMPPVAAIGFATFAGAAILAATRTPSTARRVGWSVVAGWMGACLIVVLYPPWVVPLAFVVGAGTLAALVRALPASPERRPWLLRVALVLVVAGAVVGALMVAFLAGHRDAIRAISDTVYPGLRRSTAGSANTRYLFLAPFDVLQSARSASIVDVNGSQGMEPGGLALVLVTGAALVAGSWRVMVRPWRERVVLLAMLVASAGLVAWYVLPVPSLIGKVTLLDRVPPIRLSVPIGVAGVLCFAVLVDQLAGDRLKATWWRVGAGLGVFVVGSVWVGRWLVIDGSSVPIWKVLGLVTLFAVAMGVALWGRPAGVLALAVLLGIAAAFVQPLQHGLSVLTDSPAAVLGARLRDRPNVDRVLMLSDDPGVRVIRARGGLTASGVPMISGVNLYPDAEAWRVLDPGGDQVDKWNRFNNASWGAGDPGSDPQVFVTADDAIIVIVDPCDPRLAKLGVTTVVSLKPVDRSCLRLTDTVRDGTGTALRAYRVVRNRTDRAG